MSFLLRFTFGSFSLYLADIILPCLTIKSPGNAIFAGAVLMLFYFTIRPVLRFALGIFNLLSLGLVNFLIDIALLYFITSYFKLGIEFKNFECLVLSALTVNVIRAAVNFIFRRRKRA